MLASVRPRRLVAGLAFAVGAAVCALPACSLAPEHRSPQAPIPARYDDTAPAGASLRDDDWRVFFADPELQQRIADALAHNRDLKTAVLRVEEARMLYRIQSSQRMPGVGVEAGSARAGTPADLSGAGRRITASQHSLSAVLPAYELDFWGRVRSLRDAALAEYLATDEARSAFTLALIAQVADACLIERELVERIELTEATLASREESSRIARRRYELGATSELELRLADSLLMTSRADLALLRQQLGQQHNAMDLLVGARSKPPRAGAGLGGLRIALDIPAGLPSELLTRRPDIRAAEQKLRAAEANIGAARAAFFPRIVLTGSYGSASTELDGLFAAGSSSWNFMPSLSLPIFDGGRNRTGLELARVRRELAVTAYESTVQGAFRDVADALVARRWIAEQRLALQQLQDAQTARLRLAQGRYERGASTYLEVLDAQRDLYSVQQGVVQTRRAELSNAVALYRALGGTPGL